MKLAISLGVWGGVIADANQDAGVDMSEIGDLLEGIEADDHDKVTILLNAHPELLEDAADGLRPLHWAARMGRTEIIGLLADRGADVMARDESDHATPLHWAANGGHAEAAEMLIDRGADPNADDDVHGWGPIGWATIDGVRSEVTELLLERGARPGIFSAIALNDVEAVRTVIERDPEAPGRTLSKFEHFREPLQFAAGLDQPEICELLLDSGAEIDRADWMGLTAFAIAVFEGGLDAAAALRRRGAQLDLGVELALGDEDRVRNLLAEHPDWVGAEGRYGKLLHYCAQEGEVEAAALLLEGGADPNAVIEWWGNRLAPIHPASSYGHLEVIQLLVEHGADAAARDEEFDGAPIDWAEHYGREDVVAYLESLEPPA